MVMKMDLKQLGEFGLIDLIKNDTINDPGSVVVGIGDDAAVLLPTPRQLQLVTTDMLVENVHFSLETTSPWQLGYKSVAVNFSDIAAMGGIPKQVVVSVAFTKETPVEFIVNLYQGMKEICKEFGANIVGGDTVSSPDGIVINVCAVGEVEPTNLVKRSGAQIGDVVAVTGFLGNSGAGLDLLMNGDWEEYDFALPLVTAHLTPRPQVAIGHALAISGASSMDDISDGLASEANEIAAASKVGIELYADRIPLSKELRRAAEAVGKNPLDYALFGGEDFQLVFTISPERFNELKEQEQELGKQLTAVGKVVSSQEGVYLVSEDGQRSKLEPKGYNHFR